MFIVEVIAVPVKRHFLFFIAVVAALAGYAAFRDYRAAALPENALPPLYFYDKSGHKVTLADFKGKPVLVNLWATWCVPCIKELPSLDRLQKMEEGKLVVVAVSMDREKTFEDIGAFLRKHGAAHLAVYWDQDRLVPLKWKYAGLPTSYLIDRHGVVAGRYDGGYDWDKGGVKKDIEGVIAAP